MNSYDEERALYLSKIIASGVFSGINSVLKKLFWSLAAGYLAMMIFSQILDLFKVGYDSTDGRERSGMRLMTDNLTGCQYLSAGGSLTPRLNIDGIQIGCK